MAQQWFALTVTVSPESSEALSTLSLRLQKHRTRIHRTSTRHIHHCVLYERPSARSNPTVLSDARQLAPGDQRVADHNNHRRRRRVGAELETAFPPATYRPITLYLSTVGGIHPGKLRYDHRASRYAFGTGQHATTRGCLHAIEDVTSQQSVRRAFDVGTGSGILAIALAKLGVPEVVALDTDTQACDIATENIAHNHVAPLVSLHQQYADIHGTFDVVVTNLFTRLLVEHAVEFSAQLRPNGCLICSGFLIDDRDTIHEAYTAQDLVLYNHREEAGWVTLTFQRKAQQ